MRDTEGKAHGHSRNSGRCGAKTVVPSERQLVDMASSRALLNAYRPLSQRCLRDAVLRLPQEDATVLECEVCYQFLVLIQEFDPTRCASFAGYIKAMLPQRMLNWEQKQLHGSCRKIAFSQKGDFDSNQNCDVFNSDDGVQESDMELWLWWQDSLAGLPPTQRQIMVWTLNGLSEREMAVRLRLCPARINQLKHKAQKTLQKLW